MSEYFEKAAIVWDNDPNRLHMTKTIADAMIRLACPKCTDIVLDYGTGTGNIALNLYPHVKKIIAVDSARNMLAMLAGKLEKESISSIEPREWSIGQDTADLPRFDRDRVFDDPAPCQRYVGSSTWYFMNSSSPEDNLPLPILTARMGNSMQGPALQNITGLTGKNFSRYFLRQGSKMSGLMRLP